jgi:hypothetical protein
MVSVRINYSDDLHAKQVLGADLAPPQPHTGEFLGVWALLSDSGSTFGPLAVGTLMSHTSLTVASRCVGILGFFGFLYFALFTDETLKKRAQAAPPAPPLAEDREKLIATTTV